MRTLSLRRIEATDLAMFGTLADEENKSFGVTLEPPWRDNERDVSCIPAGTYTAVRFPAGEGKRPYDVFKLIGVPDRDDTEIHIGNTIADTEGCVLLGSNYGVVNGQHGITGSQAAFRRFMDALRGIDSFPLTVIDPENSNG